MPHVQTQRVLSLAALLALLVAAPCSHAGGPLLVSGAGQPLTWAADPIPYNPDRGMLGNLSNASATSRIADAAAAWTAVTTSSISLSQAAALPVDVTVSNYAAYLQVCGDDLSPIVFDSDGRITDDLFGVGANQHIIGFAGPACGTFDPPVITEGFSVFNGRFLDGVDASNNPELTPDEFDAVLLHELGHYVGLDHSQVNFAEAADGDASNDDALATMFPILVNATQMKSLHLDDIVAVSSLYPQSSFTTDFGTITGQVYEGDGATPFQGANVIARKVGDPRITAVSQVSGARYFPQNYGGPPDPSLRALFELKGLPPGSYTVELEPIYVNFTGGSSVGPLEIPAGLPGAAEFWNGSDESASNPPDDPTVAETIDVVANSVTEGIDFVLNQGPPPSNDECAGAIEIPTTPFTDAADVTGATTGAFDPIQSCTDLFGSQNMNSVWYRYTAPADGVLHVSTDGSNYDTAVSALTGICGNLVEAGCDDISGPGVLADLLMEADAGVSYLLEATARSGGGQLSIAVDFEPAADCPSEQRTGCRAASNDRSALRLRPSPDPQSQSMQWKWLSGDATAGELGDPLLSTGTSYALCIYDGTGTLALRARAPAGDRCGSGLGECWQSRNGALKYKDRERLPDGLASVGFKAGSGDAKLKIKAGGENLDMPSLPLTAPVTIQLSNSDGGCWESSFSGLDITQNDELGLAARNR